MKNFYQFLFLIFFSGYCLAQEATKPTEIKCETIPVRKVVEIQAKGKPYQVPDTNWEAKPVLWGWTYEMPDGTGLSFGGIHQTANDGVNHTALLENGQWKPIVEELISKNQFQKHYEACRVFRNRIKDILAKVRHIYFEGKTADDEKKLLVEQNKAIETLISDANKFLTEFKNFKVNDKVFSDQYTIALKHIEASIPFLKSFGDQITVDQMASMRKAQIEFEIASDSLGAEPSPRSLSRLLYIPKIKSYFLFGGEHMDYCTNDIWIFDTTKRFWYQRFQEIAPEPRGDHILELSSDGKVILNGGYKLDKGYVHIGDFKWIYDFEKNSWSADGHAEKGLASDTRSNFYYPPAAPERYMIGDKTQSKPDAASNESKLKAIPVNTWVKMATPYPLEGHRDWGTWVYDTDKDLFYIYAGGHVSYAGNDVARYHLATDRWEITDPVELPLGCIGTNEKYSGGVNYNLRPWVRNHVWNSQTYNPDIKKMILCGVTMHTLDKYNYIYDPEKADWVSRFVRPDQMVCAATAVNVRYTKLGVLGWIGQDVWMLDSKTLEWKKQTIKGKMAGSGVDSCGMVYDPKRERMLFVTQNGYGRPFDGQITALSLANMQADQLNPEGMEALNPCNLFLREATYYPPGDLFIWNQLVSKNGVYVKNMIPAYDAGKNRWIYIKIEGATGAPFEGIGGVCSGIHYDAKRDLLWTGHTGYMGNVQAMRLDLNKAEITPIKDFNWPPKPEPKK